MPSKPQQVFSAAAVLMAALLVTDSRWRADAPQLYQLIELGGALLIVACFLGRTFFQDRRWLSAVSANAGGSGRVFLLTCMGVAGVAAQSGGLLMTLLAFLAATFTFSPLQQSGVRAPALLAAKWKLDQTAFLFLAIPIADAAEWLQAAGHLPVLLRLP